MDMYTNVFCGIIKKFSFTKAIASKASERNPVLHFPIQGFLGKEWSKGAFLPAFHPALFSFLSPVLQVPAGRGPDWGTALPLLIHLLGLPQPVAFTPNRYLKLAWQDLEYLPRHLPVLTRSMCHLLGQQSFNSNYHECRPVLVFM